MFLPRLLLASGLVFVGQCGSLLSPEAPVALNVRVVATGSAVRLTNDSGSTAFYFICESEAAALINWRASVDPKVSTFVASRAQVAVPDSAIYGYAPGKKEAIVWYWKAERSAAGTPVPGPLHSVVVSF